MTRISSLAANNSLLNQIFKTQVNLFNLQTQIGTEQVSQDYKGIGSNTQRLINLENTRNQLKNFIINNGKMDLRLEIANTTINGIRDIIRNFKKELDEFQQGATKDPVRVKDIQDDAFRALKSFEGLLNIQVNGRFLFAGSRVTTQPANSGLTTLADFQAKYDGARVSIPTTRDAHLEDFSFSKNASTSATNWLTFVRDQGGTGVSRVTATSSEFSNVTVGSTITISGTTGGTNDGTYEVVAVSGTTIDIKTEQLTNEGPTGVVITYQDPDDSNKTITLNPTLEFTRSTNTMVFSGGDVITAIPVGTKITIASASNNASFTVKSNDGTNLVIETIRFTDQGTVGAPQLSFTSIVAEVVTFTDNAPSKDTIVAAAGRFTDLKAGMKVTISGAFDGGNNITFTVSSVSTNGSTITVDENVTARVNDPNLVTFLTQEAGGTVSATSYFNGDQVSLTHRVGPDRDFEFDINAVDPAFEKAIRAMELIMQGVFKTEGGLDQNSGRIRDAFFLLSSSLNRAVSGTPPFGTELKSNMEQIELDVGFNRELIKNTNGLDEKLIAFLETSISGVEDINVVEVITRLLDEQRALETLFQAFARIRQLSLVNFL